MALEATAIQYGSRTSYRNACYGGNIWEAWSLLSKINVCHTGIGTISISIPVCNLVHSDYRFVISSKMDLLTS